MFDCGNCSRAVISKNWKPDERKEHPETCKGDMCLCDGTVYKNDNSRMTVWSPQAGHKVWISHLQRARRKAFPLKELFLRQCWMIAYFLSNERHKIGHRFVTWIEIFEKVLREYFWMSETTANEKLPRKCYFGGVSGVTSTHSFNAWLIPKQSSFSSALKLNESQKPSACTCDEKSNSQQNHKRFLNFKKVIWKQEK